MSCNFVRYGHFKCECGREFEKSQSLYAHQSHCKVHLGEEREIKDRFGDSRAWNRGLTKETNESLRKISEKASQRLKDMGNENPLVKWNKNRPKESFIRQSETRKEKYHTGQITPALGVGRGKYSYLLHADTQILLRSTYEFIYALYLLYNKVPFEYESVRVAYQGHVYISDFKINNKIVEIKGNYHYNYSKPKQAFESIGYIYEIKFWKDLVPCYKFLKSKIDIDNILEKIKEGHNSRSYYEYKYAE